MAQVRNHPSVRHTAEESLKHMTAPELMRAAVTCDYSAECMEFLRSRFDIADPDPPVTTQEVAEFDSRMRKLFLDGYILAQGQPGGPKTAARMVFSEIEDFEPPLACRSFPVQIVFLLEVHSSVLSSQDLLRRSRALSCHPRPTLAR